MEKAKLKSFDIGIEKYEDLIRRFFIDVDNYILYEVEKSPNKNVNNIMSTRILIETDLQDLINKLIYLRKDCFDKVELEKIIKKIKDIYIRPNAFIKPETIDQSAFLAFRDVINGICDYAMQPIARPELINGPLVKWAIARNTDKKKQLLYRTIPVAWVIKKEYGHSL